LINYLIQRGSRQEIRIQSGSLLAQSNCAIFCLKSSMEAGLGKKGVSNQFKSNQRKSGPIQGPNFMGPQDLFKCMFCDVERVI
jgi:hypothetical protein